jgi:hypothetical protein
MRDLTKYSAISGDRENLYYVKSVISTQVPQMFQGSCNVGMDGRIFPTPLGRRASGAIDIVLVMVALS